MDCALSTASTCNRMAVLFISAFVAISLPTNSLAQTPLPAKKQPTSASKKSKIADAVIQGQVFVVTKGGSNVKLALVSVFAFQEKDLLNQLNRTWEAEQGLRNQEALKVQDAKTAFDLAAEKYADSKNRANAAYASAVAYAGSDKGIAALNDWNAASRINSKDAAAMISAENTYIEARIRLEALSSPRHYIEKLSDPKTVTKSDAEGNFDLTVPTGIYVLTATGKRMAGGSTELYEWIVKVDVTKSNQKIMLSNDNMADAKCIECVQLPGSR